MYEKYAAKYALDKDMQKLASFEGMSIEAFQELYGLKEGDVA